ncbi:FkbM family methyltransferase [Rhodospira trueperi]|uniref:Methyltransferase, FkbM family n=1 Tax=Rhodospira trueperi TaxID=69960 RepID=A0A1G6W722_9PROT|nr:FkbM family methyltransferase [Rhodospira trueperi]SDD60846.1 methyltransferase, FkbM family [Rhodospira trueperi]
MKLLNYPVVRDLASIIATIYGRTQLRSFSVGYEDGLWVHKYDGPRYLVRERPSIPKKRHKGAGGDRNFSHDDPSQLKDVIEDVTGYAPKLGDVFVDIGAGKGTLTVALGKLVGAEGRGLSVEAHPKQYRCLSRTCALNRLDQVITEQVAVGATDGEVLISEEGNADESHVGQVDDGYNVKQTTVDKLVEAHGIGQVDFLSMNIEGAETEALLGMKSTLARCRIVAIACHDFRADREGLEEMRTKDKVISILNEAGFRISPLEQRRTKTTALDDWVSAENSAFAA